MSMSFVHTADRHLVKPLSGAMWPPKGVMLRAAMGTTDDDEPRIQAEWAWPAIAGVP